MAKPMSTTGSPGSRTLLQPYWGAVGVSHGSTVLLTNGSSAQPVGTVPVPLLSPNELGPHANRLGRSRPSPGDPTSLNAPRLRGNGVPVLAGTAAPNARSTLTEASAAPLFDYRR